MQIKDLQTEERDLSEVLQKLNKLRPVLYTHISASSVRDILMVKPSPYGILECLLQGPLRIAVQKDVFCKRRRLASTFAGAEELLMW